MQAQITTYIFNSTNSTLTGVQSLVRSLHKTDEMYLLLLLASDLTRLNLNKEPEQTTLRDCTVVYSAYD